MNTNRVNYETYKDLKTDYLELPEIEYKRCYTSNLTSYHTCQICPECGGHIINDEIRGENYCKSCGLVI